MVDNMVTSTPEDLKKFEDAVRGKLKELGLTDWDCIFKLEKLEESNAAVRYCTPSRKATFRLAMTREEFKPVEEHALHEALELLLADIAVYMGAYYSDDLINNEIHRLINRLMPLFTETQAIKLKAIVSGDPKYMELIMTVSKKYPGETRHETALRYIRAAERSSADTAAKEGREET